MDFPGRLSQHLSALQDASAAAAATTSATHRGRDLLPAVPAVPADADAAEGEIPGSVPGSVSEIRPG